MWPHCRHDALFVGSLVLVHLLLYSLLRPTLHICHTHAMHSDSPLRAVRRKLVLLLAPFLHRYDYMWQAENMATPMPTMKPPREDLFAPDLYIPLHAVFTYVVLSACNRFIGGSFKPDVMYNMVGARLPACAATCCKCVSYSNVC